MTPASGMDHVHDANPQAYSKVAAPHNLYCCNETGLDSKVGGAAHIDLNITSAKNAAEIYCMFVGKRSPSNIMLTLPSDVAAVPAAVGEHV